jgi:predicted mannosyl-3-phosphoglycerate phosphatase (HAD superfamily)
MRIDLNHHRRSDVHIDLAPIAPPRVTAISPSIVVISAIDGAMRASDGTCEEVRTALDLLADRGVPVVLMSHAGPDDVQDVQAELGLRHPFICNGGAALYIPRGYFMELDGLTAGNAAWEVFEFGVPDPARAIRLLSSLFSVSGEEILTVGFASDWKDRALLAAVDVPIVVRNGSFDQQRLVRRVPGAYLTDAEGPAGWSEAVLGSAV